MPEPVAETQWIDVSAERLRGTSFLKSKDFRVCVAKIVKRIEEIAETIRNREVETRCDTFKYPSNNAFADYHREIESLPLTGPRP